eukprot:15366251-Ditylum_brightwellii.AAC.3
MDRGDVHKVLCKQLNAPDKKDNTTATIMDIEDDWDNKVQWEETKYARTKGTNFLTVCGLDNKCLPQRTFTQVIVQEGPEKPQTQKENTMPNPMASCIGWSGGGLWAAMEQGSHTEHLNTRGSNLGP